MDSVLPWRPLECVLGLANGIRGNDVRTALIMCSDYGALRIQEKVITFPFTIIHRDLRTVRGLMIGSPGCQFSRIHGGNSCNNVLHLG